MRTNCYLWARREYSRRLREWIAAGMPAGGEPYWIERPSRLDPRWITHRMIGRYDPEIDAIRVVSFCPCDHSALPWWRVWAALLFAGRVQRGDWPMTKPE